jgi:hypothetical protein
VAIGICRHWARGRMSERDQLRLTVRSVVDDTTLRNFMGSNSQITDHLCAKAQTIKGVERLQQTHSQTDLRDQVADRIYAIRCPIVHTKDDGGESGVDLLCHLAGKLGRLARTWNSFVLLPSKRS